MRNGPHACAPGSPKGWVRNPADVRWSRHHTMWWLSSIAISHRGGRVASERLGSLHEVTDHRLHGVRRDQAAVLGEHVSLALAQAAPGVDRGVRVEEPLRDVDVVVEGHGDGHDPG